MSKKSKKIPRRLLTATMSCVFMISLSSCSGAGNSYGKLDQKELYATSGSYEVTKGELWDELKWSASSKLDAQIENVILNDQIQKITLVMNSKYEDLSEKDKETYGSKESFDALKKKYSERLTDYVVQDIYNFSFSSEDYWDQVDDLLESQEKVLRAKYIDEIYANYKIDKIGSNSLEDLVHNASKDNDNYLTIATNLTSVYYPSFAKELLAEEKLIEEVKEANEKDDDLDDDKLGYYSNTDYVSKFKGEYANQHDLNLVLIRFNSDNEFKDTLRAFGLKIYNKQFYYVSGINPETNEERTYSDYCKYYDDLSNSELKEVVDSSYMLEIYIQLYNYLYSGYRTKLKSGLNLPEITQLDKLRTEITNKILNESADMVYKNALAALEENKEILTYTREDLNEISSSFITYAYETLDLEDVTYSTATQNYNSSYYIAYKFGEAEKENDLYNKDLTNDEIMEIITKEENKELKDKLQSLLITEGLTETKINSYLTEAKKDVKIKIYNEATEISYARSNSDYSKTLSGNKNKNVLATIEYKKTKWNLNIVADENDSKSILIPGTNQKYGVFDELEREDGQTTAIDILSKKIIKDTDAYKETNEDRDLYNNYIEVILYNFANEGYSTSGYPSSIGKYNFLMLYFHSANIDEIIDDFYRVQFASSKLLVDYSSDKLNSFIKSYTDKAYDNYFSLNGTRLVVYFDGDDNNEPDEVSENWPERVVDFDGSQMTLEEISKKLVYEFYIEINASTEDHSTKLDALVSEYNGSARVAFENNPIVPENQWAKYKKVGLNVKTETFSVTNSSTDVDFTLKDRLYKYSDPNGDYQYFKNGTTPSIYIEPLDEACVATGNDTIIQTNDGYNLILVTEGQAKPSAEWKATDYDDSLLTNLKIKYNEDYIEIPNIYNEDEKLTSNQIKLYLLEYVTSNTSNLTPNKLSSACSTFLSPVITRFTGNETQRQIVLEYITNNAKIEWKTEGYTEVLDKITVINQRIADDYISLYDDITGTSISFPDWWTNLSAYLKEAK